ncbi:N-acetyltransferase isoform X2 [Wolffia australiana]
MRGRRRINRWGSCTGSPSTLRSPLATAVGNCTVEVEGCGFTCERHTDKCLEISTMRPAKIRVSAVESSFLRNDLSVMMLNPNDPSEHSRSLVQEVISVYSKELPNMNYAANTGKRSGFIGKSVSGGKYQTLALKTISSEGQGVGLGRLLYLELRRRLKNVGVSTIFCWGDKVSEGFWIKQGFTSVGDVDGRGRARRLPIRASLRKKLCFPGDSTLMVSHLDRIPLNSDGFTKSEQIVFGEIDLVVPESIPEDDKKVSQSQSSPSEVKKRCLWEASLTSLKSKRIRGSHPTEHGVSSDCNYDFNHDPGVAHDGRCSSDALINDDDGNFRRSDGSQDGKKPRIFFMNISDEIKKELLRKTVEELGGSVASDGRFATHVITGKALRTLNFCSALCSGAWILSSNWLKQSHREKRFLDEMSFILEDEDYALKYKSTIRDAVTNARANPGSLLKGYSIGLGEHIQPPPNVLSIIISSAGGLVINGFGGILTPSKTIFIASEEDMEEGLLAAKKGIWTFSSDWLMSCIMRQELDFEAPQFLEPL